MTEIEEDSFYMGKLKMQLFLPPSVLQNTNFEEMYYEEFIEKLSEAKVIEKIYKNIFAEAISEVFGEKK